MAKPQILFSDHVDNSLSRSPFKPNLPTKHHAMVPLDFVPPLDYTPDSDSMSASLQMEKEIRLRQHPYFYETRHLPYPTAMFTTSPPIKPSPLDETSAIWVDTPAALEEMVEQLRTSKEIAVDLEHHDTHSYYGFTCLMQISTREHDWIVDTLALRQELRDDKLGGVMADPAVLKVSGFTLLQNFVLIVRRCFMVPIRISVGCKRILTFTSATYLTPTMRLASLVRTSSVVQCIE